MKTSIYPENEIRSIIRNRLDDTLDDGWPDAMDDLVVKLMNIFGMDEQTADRYVDKYA